MICKICVFGVYILFDWSRNVPARRGPLPFCRLPYSPYVWSWNAWIRQNRKEGKFLILRLEKKSNLRIDDRPTYYYWLMLDVKSSFFLSNHLDRLNNLFCQENKTFSHFFSTWWHCPMVWPLIGWQKPPPKIN